MYYAAFTSDNFTKPVEEKQYTVFFTNGCIVGYDTLDELVDNINHADFEKVTRYHYVFSSKMYLREDVTKRIKNILAFENDERE